LAVDRVVGAPTGRVGVGARTHTSGGGRARGTAGVGTRTHAPGGGPTRVPPDLGVQESPPSRPRPRRRRAAGVGARTYTPDGGRPRCQTGLEAQVSRQPPPRPRPRGAAGARGLPPGGGLPLGLQPDHLLRNRAPPAPPPHPANLAMGPAPCPAHLHRYSHPPPLPGLLEKGRRRVRPGMGLPERGCPVGEPPLSRLEEVVTKASRGGVSLKPAGLPARGHGPGDGPAVEDMGLHPGLPPRNYATAGGGVVPPVSTPHAGSGGRGPAMST